MQRPAAIRFLCFFSLHWIHRKSQASLKQFMAWLRHNNVWPCSSKLGNSKKFFLIKFDQGRAPNLDLGGGGSLIYLSVFRIQVFSKDSQETIWK